MYTKDGIRVVSPRNLKDKKLIPWDSIRSCKVGGRSVIRHVVVLKKEYFPIFICSNGVGGFKTERDVGRTLIVDLLPDGRWIDYIE